MVDSIDGTDSVDGIESVRRGQQPPENPFAAAATFDAIDAIDAIDSIEKSSVQPPREPRKKNGKPLPYSKTPVRRMLPPTLAAALTGATLTTGKLHMEKGTCPVTIPRNSAERGATCIDLLMTVAIPLIGIPVAAILLHRYCSIPFWLSVIIGIPVGTIGLWALLLVLSYITATIFAKRKKKR